MSGLKVEKRERENSRQLVGRFIRSLRKSGLVYRAKKYRYAEKSLSGQLKKKAALRREELKKKYERLEKLGRTR
ncbi:MAG: hypothetical protein U9Q96_01245 [Patescibacteria group bacterium]|nr:hypothetical protein [Patescibacteria group bacterium]